MGSFEMEHGKWLQSHLERREGERLFRLQEGHGYLERRFLEDIWWPAFGHFHDLHPQYQIKDFKDGWRYLDIAYIPSFMRLVVETDGFGPHVKDITPEKHADILLRDVHLLADGWKVLHVSTYLIKNSPRQLQQLLQQIVWGRAGQGSGNELKLSLEEKEVIAFSRIKGSSITPLEVSTYIEKCPSYSRKILKSLVDKGYLRIVGGSVRARAYELIHT